MAEIERPDTCCCIEITCSHCRTARNHVSGVRSPEAHPLHEVELLRHDPDHAPERGPPTDRDQVQEGLLSRSGESRRTDRTESRDSKCRDLGDGAHPTEPPSESPRTEQPIAGSYLPSRSRSNTPILEVQQPHVSALRQHVANSGGSSNSSYWQQRSSLSGPGDTSSLGTTDRTEMFQDIQVGQPNVRLPGFERSASSQLHEVRQRVEEASRAKNHQDRVEFDQLGTCRVNLEASRAARRAEDREEIDHLLAKYLPDSCDLSRSPRRGAGLWTRCTVPSNRHSSLGLSISTSPVNTHSLSTASVFSLDKHSLSSSITGSLLRRSFMSSDCSLSPTHHPGNWSTKLTRRSPLILSQTSSRDAHRQSRRQYLGTGSILPSFSNYTASLADSGDWVQRRLSNGRTSSEMRRSVSASETVVPGALNTAHGNPERRSARTGRARDTYHDVRRNLERDPLSVNRCRRRSRSFDSAERLGSPGVCRSDVDVLSDMLKKCDTSMYRKSVQFSQHQDHQHQHQQRQHQRAGSYGLTDHDTSVMGRSLPLPPRGELPSPEETVRLLQNQSVLMQQMEAENRYCKSELQELKTKVKGVVDENRLLHEELKRSVVEEIVQSDVSVPGLQSHMVPPSQSGPTGGGTPHRSMTVQDYGKWQRELERITTLHTAKAKRLEAQLTHAREEATQAEGELEVMRAKVRMSESLGAVGLGGAGSSGLAFGLCIRCSENEAVTVSTLATQKSSMERITRERDDLMSQLTSMKTTLQEMRQREEDSYMQVNKSVQMVEQAQLEQTQALVQREQLKDELLNMRKRMEEHVEEMQLKMVAEREAVRLETKVERNELNNKLKEMTERLVAAEMQLDKTTREKVSLMAEVEAARGELCSFDMDYNKATDTMKMSMTHANVERNAALNELKRSKVELDQLQRDKLHEEHRCSTELKDLRRRLVEAENELLVTKEQCIHLTTEIQALSRETHLAKLAKESLEKSRRDDLNSITKRADTREEELNMLIETLENKHGQTTAELDEIIRTQNVLIQKLREECHHLARQLEKLTAKYKGDNKHLSSLNAGLKLSLAKSRKRVSELEQQNAQHAELADKMRQRLRQMDAHSKHCSGQIIELLAKESSLMRDRQLLAREIEFLRQEATNMNDSDVDRIFAARGDLVDEVLTKVNDDTVMKETLKARETRPKSAAVLIETDRGMQTDDFQQSLVM